MVNFKKIDDKDLVFVNKPLSTKEEKEFSEFLQVKKNAKKRRRSQLGKVNKSVAVK